MQKHHPPSAQSWLSQSSHVDIFGMRSYQNMVSDVTVFAPARTSAETLVEAVKKLRAPGKDADPADEGTQEAPVR
jgi:hypothetical protein